jgi:5'-nucleotidase/UDP-sugar diphosphatase
MKNRILRILPIIIILSLIVNVISGLSIESDNSLKNIIILHINDTHGHLTPYDDDKSKDIGGMTRVATLIKEMKKENPDSTLILHAGDELSRGDAPTVCFGGEVNMQVIDSIGFDAFTPGNGDFYFSVSNLLKQITFMKVPVLLSNVVYKNNEERLFPSYIIKEVNGVKIAILGFGVIREDHPSGRILKLRDPIQSTKEILPEIMGKSDIIIALSHIGLGADILLAEKCPEIDIIVGGHSHNQLNEPMFVPKKDGKGNVIIVQAGEYTKYLGQLDIGLKKSDSGKYKIVKADGKLIPIDNKIKEDNIALDIIKKYDDKLSEVLCELDDDIPYKKNSNNPIGIFTAEAVRLNTGSDIALIDLGSVERGIRKGKVTLKEACMIHPWHNQILIYELTGKQIQEVLSEKDSYIAGCTYVKSDGIADNIKINGLALDKSKTYIVAFDEFLSTYTKSLQGLQFEETGKTINNIIIDYLMNHTK